MYIGKTRSPVVVLLLSIFTCGIYSFFWMYTCADEINKITGQERINPVLFLVSLFIPYLPLYFMHKADQNLIEIGKNEGVLYDSKFILWLILYLVGIGPLVFMYQAQEMFNSVWQARSSRNA